MQVKILLHANFREIVGKREIIEEINPDSTVGQVLDMLARKYGKDFKSIIDPKNGEVSPELLVLLNGRSVRKTDIKLKNDDILIITIPVGGG